MLCSSFSPSDIYKKPFPLLSRHGKKFRCKHVDFVILLRRLL
jgi:hypothetical protein